MDWQCVKGVFSSSQDYLFPKIKSGGNTARVNRHTPFSTVLYLTSKNLVERQNFLWTDLTV